MSDRSAFTHFAAAHSTRLLRSAYLLTGDRGDAEDLVQDVLERLYVAWPTVRDPLAYARAALTHRAVIRWRGRRRRQEVARQPAHEPVAEDGSARRADRSVLVTALADLPPRQRAVVVLRYLEDLDEASTAAALGCSVGTVKSQCHRALASLRSILGDRVDPGVMTDGGTR